MKLQNLINEAIELANDPFSAPEYNYNPYKPNIGPGALWTEKEERFIVDNWSLGMEILQRFTHGRSAGAIKSRYNKLLDAGFIPTNENLEQEILKKDYALHLYL